MTVFGDRVLRELSDPGTLGTLLLPSADADGKVRTMLGATYDLTAVRIDGVSAVQVRDVALERPVFRAGRQDGSWSQLVPAYTRTEVSFTVPSPADPLWVDVLAEIDVTVVAEVDPSGAESVLSKGFDTFTTLDEFRARFTFLDLDAFLAEHHISTVEELRDAFDYVVTEIQLRTPTTFHADDPANTHTLPVTLAAVVSDPFDLTAGLRATRLVREAATTLTGAVPAGIPTEVTAAYATAVVAAADGLDTADIERLYATEGVVTLFLSTD
ncbi:hypothetical protein [Actinophytocola sp.]|uniref:hypothetical protein n=1 Tax=Actinophytocola sp. TaxID=1872138 RepID=UPI00389A6150